VNNAEHCVECNVLLQSTVITYVNGVASNLHYGVKYLLSYNSGKIIDISHNLTKLLRKLQTVFFPDTTWMSQEMSFFEIKSINPSLTHTHTPV